MLEEELLPLERRHYKRNKLSQEEKKARYMLADAKITLKGSCSRLEQPTRGKDKATELREKGEAEKDVDTTDCTNTPNEQEK